MDRSYTSALSTLNSAIKKDSNIISMEVHRELREKRVDNMLAYLKILDIGQGELKKLNVIHVTGSKGKGSTCAFIEGMLRTLGFRTGMLSSPHLIDVEERIRINGRPLSREAFANVFWDVHARLATQPELQMPTFLIYLVLMAIQAFVQEKVDVAILEVGIGGRYDYTNICSHPRVCAASSLALEHTNLLGNTLSKIAWRKAGIFKPGASLVVSADQTEEALKVFVEEAELQQSGLFIAPTVEEVVASLPCSSTVYQQLDTLLKQQTPCPELQTLNIGLSLAVVHLWLQQMAGTAVPSTSGEMTKLSVQPDIAQVQGLSQVHWPGRWQTVQRQSVAYYIDGAHTLESIPFAIKWFEEESRKMLVAENTALRVLIFTVLGPRDPTSMLKSLRTLPKMKFDAAIFVDPHDDRYVVLPDKQSRDLKCLAAWHELGAESEETACHECVAFRIASLRDFVHWLEQHATFSTRIISSYPGKIDEQSQAAPNCNATEFVETTPKDIGSAGDILRSQCHIFVTGSLHLAGGMLQALDEVI